VETRPIKGTQPRSGNPILDLQYKEKLEASQKDHAENTMIVDLLRNDLSKVCLAASVEVTDLCKLESFASVHHLVSTVRGKLKSGKTALDLLRACFPGGSITGAPKIRAMEIIEELEPTRRGPYCGAMAYIGFDGTMDSSILIRTLVYDRNKVSLQVGGGIVADSNADQEYQETFDKAAAMFRSFEAPAQADDEELLAG
jgi:para-aminobenzoate synthetase component 1